MGLGTKGLMDDLRVKVEVQVNTDSKRGEEHCFKERHRESLTD